MTEKIWIALIAAFIPALVSGSFGIILLLLQQRIHRLVNGNMSEAQNEIRSLRRQLNHTLVQLNYYESKEEENENSTDRGSTLSSSRSVESEGKH